MKYLIFFGMVSGILLVISCNNSEKKNNNSSAAEAYVNAETPKKDQSPELQKSIARGEGIYADFCMQCHLPNGKGVPGTFPPLAGSNWLTEKRTESIHAVKYGQSGEIIVNGKKYNNSMPPMGLEDKEVADVLNYIMNSWGNTQETPVTPEEVAAIPK